MISWFRYVPHGRLCEFLAKGWEIVDEMYGVHHGAYSCLCRWAGEGEPPRA